MRKASGLFAVDVDGTLVTDHGRITDKVYRALEKAVSAKWEVVIASGRTFYKVLKVLDELPFLRYAVLSNGACIVDTINRRVLHMEKLPLETAEKIIHTMRAHGAIPALYTTNIEDQRIYYDTLDGACDFFTWYVTKDPRCVFVDDVLRYTEDALQIGTIAEKEKIWELRDVLGDLEARVQALPFENASFGGKNKDFWFLQIVEAKATKHKALKRVYDWLEIPAGRLVAVGDNYNDADMIAHSDIGVAMGNAPDEIKKLARVIVGSNNDSGLSQVVEEVLLSGKYFP